MESIMLRLVIERENEHAEWRFNEWSRQELRRFNIRPDLSHMLEMFNAQTKAKEA